MLIAVDAMGGDFAPDEIVKGALACAPRVDARIALVGDPNRLLQAGAGARLPDNVIVTPASQTVGMGENPTVALRTKKDSSLAVAVGMVRDRRASAVVSAGNSGAFLTMAHMYIKPVQGILRPAIAVVMPGASGPWVLIDGGANADCKPAHLAQFGVMASIYCEYALGLKRPRVGVLSIGEERGKGSEISNAAHALLAEAPLNFIGNVEGDEVFEGAADVVVADGFAGNVMLKTAEGMAHLVASEIAAQVSRSVIARIGAVFMRGAFRRTKRKFDYSTVGGALLLGVNGICVVGHGRSDARAVENAILVAYRAVRGRVVEHMAEAMGQLRASSPAPVTC